MVTLRLIRGDFLLIAEPAWWLEEGEKKVCVGTEGAVMDSVGRRMGPEFLALPCPPSAWWTVAESCHLWELVSCSRTRG